APRTLRRARSHREATQLIVPLFFFGWNCQSEYGCRAFAGDVDAAHIFRVGKVQSAAVLAAVHFGIASPGLFNIAACLLENIVGVVPALEMAAAKLVLGVFLIAGTLANFLDLDFV